MRDFSTSKQTVGWEQVWMAAQALRDAECVDAGAKPLGSKPSSAPYCLTSASLS